MQILSLHRDQPSNRRGISNSALLLRIVAEVASSPLWGSAFSPRGREATPDSHMRSWKQGRLGEVCPTKLQPVFRICVCSSERRGRGRLDGGRLTCLVFVLCLLCVRFVSAAAEDWRRQPLCPRFCGCASKAVTAALLHPEPSMPARACGRVGVWYDVLRGQKAMRAGDDHYSWNSCINPSESSLLEGLAC